MTIASAAKKKGRPGVDTFLNTFPKHEAAAPSAAARALGGLAAIAAANKPASPSTPQPAAATMPWSKWPIEVIRLDRIAEDGQNHREPTAEEKSELLQLGESLKHDGQVHPIAVHPRYGAGEFTPAGMADLYLIFGSRRLAAAKLAGLEMIEARVSPAKLTEEQVQLYRARENNERRELNPAEKALQAHRLVNTYLRHNHTIEAAVRHAANVLHTSESKVARMMHVIERLAEKTRAILAAGGINLSHAWALSELSDPVEQAELAGQIAKAAHVDPDDTGAGGSKAGRIWSETEVKNAVALHKKSLRPVSWKLDVVIEGRPHGRRMCLNCPANTATPDPTLPGMLGFFADNQKKGGDGEGVGTCTDDACFQYSQQHTQREQQATVSALKKQVKEKKIEKDQAVTIETVRAAAPAFVKEASMQRLVRSEFGMGEKPAPSTGGKTPKTAGPRPEAVALFKWGKAYTQWAEAKQKELDRLIETKPDVRLAALLLHMADAAWPEFDYPDHESNIHPEYGSHRGGKPPVEKALSPRHTALLKSAAAVAKGGDAGKLLLEVKVPFDHSWPSPVQHLNGLGPEAVQAICKAFGVDAGSPPVPENFLPKKK